MYKLTILCLALCAYQASAACPTIISRSGWGARPPRSTTPLSIQPVPYVTIHHGASGSCSNQADCAAMVRSYQNQHMDVNGWSDIGYNFIVGEDGNAYEGRGWNNAGAHAPGYNFHSIGICVIGNFQSHAPNQAALNAVRNLMQCGVDRGEIQGDFEVLGHRQAVTTECPGNSFYAVIQGWPEWTSSPDPLRALRNSMENNK